MRNYVTIRGAHKKFWSFFVTAENHQTYLVLNIHLLCSELPSIKKPTINVLVSVLQSKSHRIVQDVNETFG